ncbi:mediator of RNA polymerase II transcription complex subunit 8-domain-containing protein [Pestalotiopsis sp. NC0098]|nr:mediator of RNA polymerase II transcription complex subunit 8-domain-containing protein [Pestalotiopsis sp. NC0098]
MASLNITPEELKALEQTRQRLQQVSDSIGTLKNGVINSSPLPNLVSLQNSADILQATMRSLLTNMSNNDELFSRLAVHPSTNFPGRTQENILLQLLRKKRRGYARRHPPASTACRSIIAVSGQSVRRRE